ncbi:PAS domain-containing hybrid sensor histidine kinase/response regulator [Pseudomonas sp. P1.8]|uniref:PAS domain-containing hybrid sensor histidine kinase/response regulator n=1 Tax=Pseudomonas sp. P1.8 TaxID=1699310 RepID=UPI00069E998D|nr:PAS domain-containing hybrid sensor histidine kinase/response regulator [Pseudomonas sp. P1.8]
MSLERLSKLISVGFGLVLVACLISVTLDEYYGDQAAQATERRHQTIIVVAQMATLNSELTQLARLYVGTGEQLLLTQYDLKWKEGRAFQDAATNLRAIGLTEREGKLLDAVEVMDRKQTGMERSAMKELWRSGASSLLASTTYITSEWNFASALNQLRSSISKRLNADFEAAWEKAELAAHISILMQLITLGAGLLVFWVVLRRQLMVPLLALSDRMRRLHTGETIGELGPMRGLAEVVSLAEALDAYVDLNEELLRQHWVKGHLGELMQALQSCSDRELFVETLQQHLSACLDCEVDLLFDTSCVVRTDQVHYSLPLFQDGQQLASLELYFSHRLDPAQRDLLDAMVDPLSGLLSLLQQRTRNQQLLGQACQQATQLESQALVLQQRQESLELTESWYRGIVEFAPKALLVFDEHSVILANQESEVTFGYTHGNLLGKTYRMLLPESQLPLVDRMIERACASKGLETAQVIARRADGSDFPVELRLCLLPARQGQGKCLCVAIRDLTQREADERLLREAHEQQQAIVSAAPYGLAMVRGMLILQVNSRLDELLGYAPGEQLQRTPLIWMDHIMPAEAMLTFEAEVRQTLDRGEVYHQQMQLCRKDGSSFWASVSARAVAPGQLSSRGSIWIIEDVTAQHAAADEMRQARQLAEDSSRIKAEFLANMSHEIRTPMNAIIGMTYLTLRTDLSERQRDYLSKVQSSSRHLLGVLDDILDFSKIEAGKLQLEVRDFSLTQMLEEVLDQVRPRIDDKRLGMQFNVGANVPERLCGDPLRLRQILLNYLSNAVKFTERGHIRLEVSLREAGVDDALLRFSVIDSGIGLSAEQLKHIFQSFLQADASTTRCFGGTGLGLAIAKQLAEMMGGQVGVQSVLGEGSNFWFEVRLNLAQSDVLEGLFEEEGLSDWRVAEGTRILLVEDNELNQQVAAELLQAVGCVVEIAANGSDALRRLVEERYDLVFMDMQMPVLDGLTATRRLRQLPGLSTLPVVAMTANARQCDHDACLAAGMTDFISKPFEPQMLYSVLQRLLTETQDNQERTVPLASNSCDVGFNLDGVDMAAGLRRVLGKHSLYLELLQRYLIDQGPSIEKLSAAMASGELAQAELLAHSCKGVSATIGADAVAQAADSLEQALQAKRPEDQLQVCLDVLTQPLTALLEQLRQRLPRETEASLTEVSWVELLQVSRDLDVLLADFDAQTVLYFSIHAGMLRSAFANRFPPLEAAVKRFDFERARVCLSEALQACEAVAVSG